MVVIGFAAVWLLLCGSNNFKAFGAIKVEVTIKKISNRKTMSVIDDMLNAAFTLFLFFSAILLDYTGSFNKSINSDVVASILNTTFSTFETKML